MNPTFFYQNGNLPLTDFITFDTIPSTEKNLFSINRTSDSAQSYFTNSQVTDGTYSTFVNGTTGKVNSFSYGKLTLSQNIDAKKPLLIQNGNSPFLDFNNAGMFLSGRHNLSLKRDFVFTIICNKEFGSSGQRQNFGILSNDKCYFSFSLNGVDSVNVTVNSTIPLPSTPNAVKAIDNLEGFRLITVTYLNGVINVYKNNSLLNNGGTPNSPSTNPFYNKILLNGTGQGFTDERINKYKHFSVRSGADLTTFNVSTYNQSIMTKYSIT